MRLTEAKQLGARDERDLTYPYGKADPDEATLAEILNALHWQTGIRTDEVRVSVVKGRVVLSGRVDHDYERELAENAAWAATGVTDVVNHIEAAS